MLSDGDRALLAAAAEPGMTPTMLAANRGLTRQRMHVLLRGARKRQGLLAAARQA
jgi:hypothetical protein